MACLVEHIHCSLANKEARCRDYIKHRDWQLVKVLKDVGSGKSAERANYQELLQAISEKRVDVYRALEAFSRSDVGFASVQEAFDTTTAMGRASLKNEAAMQPGHRGQPGDLIEHGLRGTR